MHCSSSHRSSFSLTAPKYWYHCSLNAMRNFLIQLLVISANLVLLINCRFWLLWNEKGQARGEAEGSLIYNNLQNSKERLSRKRSDPFKSTDIVSKTSPPLCGEYRGVLHIREGDLRSASGTVFFMYVINHIIYAEEQQLLPWIHLDPAKDTVVYDPHVHGRETRNITIHDSFVSRRGRKHPDYACKVLPNQTTGIKTWKFPGKLSIRNETSQCELTGNGIWDSYFQPTLDLSHCQDLPIVQLGTFMVYPGLHTCAPWTVSGWPHPWTPTYLTPAYQNISIHEWSRIKRRRASQVIRKYYRPLDWLRVDIDQANPTTEGNCLAMHIRLTDKGDGRIQLPLSAFEPYAHAYAKYAPSEYPIYVATDDSNTLKKIQEDWSIQSRLLYRKETLRSESKDALFDIYANARHRTNTEALAEIYAMAKCDILVHGFSAMTEATIAINFGQLENQSFNIDLGESDMFSRFEASLSRHFQSKE